MGRLDRSRRPGNNSLGYSQRKRRKSVFIQAFTKGRKLGFYGTHGHGGIVGLLLAFRRAHDDRQHRCSKILTGRRTGVATPHSVRLSSSFQFAWQSPESGSQGDRVPSSSSLKRLPVESIRLRADLVYVWIALIGPPSRTSRAVSCNRTSRIRHCAVEGRLQGTSRHALRDP